MSDSCSGVGFRFLPYSEITGRPVFVSRSSSTFSPAAACPRKPCSGAKIFFDVHASGNQRVQQVNRRPRQQRGVVHDNADTFTVGLFQNFIYLVGSHLYLSTRNSSHKKQKTEQKTNTFHKNGCGDNYLLQKRVILVQK